MFIKMLPISLWPNIILCALFFVSISYAECLKEADLSPTYCDGTGWLPYKDEKCYKLIKRWATRADATNICAQEWLQTDPSIPQLVTIKSAEEQNYLTKYIFDTSAVEINVWIGARRQQQSNTYAWDDGSVVEFANWAEGSPSENVKIACVEMQSEFVSKFSNSSETNLRKRVNGKWRDVTCELPNYVICEKLQRWSFGKMQQSFLYTRKEMKDSFDLVTQELGDTKNRLANTQAQLSGTQNLLSNTQSQLDDTRNQLVTTQNNPVPIGFIYAQLPNQPEAKAIWPNVQWTDVTAEFAGLFFRAEGGGAEQFGSVQSENAPRVTEVRHVGPITDGPKWQNTILSPGGWSSGFGVFTGSLYGNAYGHLFYQSGGEIRPRNMAMRIWKRVG